MQGRMMGPKESRGVRRQHLWDQVGDLSNGGFLAHGNPKESEDHRVSTPKNCAKLAGRF